MTLDRGNFLAKVNSEGNLIIGESYHQFEVVDLTSTQSLSGLLGRERTDELGGGSPRPMGEVYQIVLLRVQK